MQTAIQEEIVAQLEKYEYVNKYCRKLILKRVQLKYPMSNAVISNLHGGSMGVAYPRLLDGLPEFPPDRIARLDERLRRVEQAFSEKLIVDICKEPDMRKRTIRKIVKLNGSDEKQRNLVREYDSRIDDAWAELMTADVLCKERFSALHKVTRSEGRKVDFEGRDEKQNRYVIEVTRVNTVNNGSEPKVPVYTAPNECPARLREIFNEIFTRKIEDEGGQIKAYVKSLGEQVAVSVLAIVSPIEQVSDCFDMAVKELERLLSEDGAEHLQYIDKILLIPNVEEYEWVNVPKRGCL